MWNLIANLIIILPLISSIINGVWGNRLNKINKNLSYYLSLFFMILTSVFSIFIFDYVGILHHITHKKFFSWFNLENISVNFGIYIDSLSVIIMLLVNIISTVIHIYSSGYMNYDKNIAKYFSYLSLFTFFMLLLVSSGNILQMFLAWEGMGFCSYLMIGFWNEKDKANNAALKAFIVNKISDVALLIGFILLIIYTGHSDLKYLLTHANMLSIKTANIFGFDMKIIEIICSLIFVGVMGKSAQIAFHVWLPDAMEGPTPASALIHAATMVVAGVFLIVRCSYIFQYAPITLNFITIIAALTCLITALLAIFQNDLKKIIAYSTCSQISYMFLAIGASSYNAAIFHLITHAFFKSLLFLLAGNIIYICHEQDIRKLGGLASQMPVTYSNFICASLALVGIYPFSGFYSKDLILESLYNNGSFGYITYYIGIIVTILTAIYSMKMILFIFHGKTRISRDSYNTINEVPNFMNLILNILVMGSLFSGMIGYYLLSMSKLSGYFANSIVQKPHISQSLYIQTLPMISSICGILIAIYIYNKYKFEFIYKSKLIENKFYFDVIYNKIFVYGTRILSQLLYIFDVLILDNIFSKFTANIAKFFSYNINKLQTGNIFHYNLFFVIFIIICINLFVFMYIFKL